MNHTIRPYELGGTVELEFMPHAELQTFYSRTSIDIGDTLSTDAFQFQVVSVNILDGGLLSGQCKKLK